MSTNRILAVFMAVFVVVTAYNNDDDMDQLIRRRASPECEPCPPGYGLVGACNDTSSSTTYCQPCLEGEFSYARPHRSPCRPCSECGDGLYERHQCTDQRDTRCDSCVSPRAIHNADFADKCGRESLGELKADEEQAMNEENVGVVDDGKREHRGWRFADDEEEEKSESLSRARHHRRGWGVRCWLLVIVLFMGICSLVVMVVRVCTLRHRGDKGFSYAHLSEQNNTIIRQCADHLAKMEEKNSKQAVNGKENPMDKWLQV